MKAPIYILDDDGEPIPETDPLKWAVWFQKANKTRIVKQEKVGPYEVSTVFLGMDHNFSGGEPILWETMVFNAKREEQDIDRCSGSREQAEAMHACTVQKWKDITDGLRPWPKRNI